MRKVILSAILALGVLGILAATPAPAKAFWPNGGVSTIRVGPFGNTTVSGSTFLRWNNSINSASAMLSTAPVYRTYFGPGYTGKAWMSRGSIGWTYNPIFGLNYTVTTPTYSGYSFSSFYGFQPYLIPSMTYTVPAGFIIP